MVNEPTIEPGNESQAVKGQNTNKSTQQVQDARNGVGSNTSVGNSTKSNAASEGE